MARDIDKWTCVDFQSFSIKGTHLSLFYFPGRVKPILVNPLPDDKS